MRVDQHDLEAKMRWFSPWLFAAAVVLVTNGQGIGTAATPATPAAATPAAATPVAATPATPAAATPATPASANRISFDMVVSQCAQACLPNAHGEVTITSDGEAEDMTVVVSGLPPNTGFDFFVIQFPNAPFGLSWYQGDIDTNDAGNGVQHFRGRFNIETFIVAPGAALAPKVFSDNATTNPPTPPVQIYHLGLWFNSHDDAAAAGCPSNVTPFNGEHVAGIQVLNTSNFLPNNGPLFNLQ